MAVGSLYGSATKRGPLPVAPPVGSFVNYPRSWYLFGTADEVQRRPVSKSALGKSLVAFRTQSGRISVLAAECSHLRADLACGDIVGESLRCPFHHWRYGVDGRCLEIPGSSVIPPTARQRAYPTEVRHGLIFFFNGNEPDFPLPFFVDEDPVQYRPGRSCRFVANCSWYMLAAHGFDRQHFESVHARRLTSPLLVDSPHECARRSRYQAAVVGTTIFDRLLRRFIGDEVSISITTWGGTMILITGDFRRARSRFMIATTPIDDGHTQCEVIVFGHCGRSALSRHLAEPLALEVRRWFTAGYMIEEMHKLGHPRYNPAGLIECDREMIEYFQWAATLK